MNWLKSLNTPWQLCEIHTLAAKHHFKDTPTLFQVVNIYSLSEECVCVFFPGFVLVSHNVLMIHQCLMQTMQIIFVSWCMCCTGLSHLHLQFLGGCCLQLSGNRALQRVSDQSQSLAAVVGHSQDLALHRLSVHPIALQRRGRHDERWQMTGGKWYRRPITSSSGRAACSVGFDTRVLYVPSFTGITAVRERLSCSSSKLAACFEKWKRFNS